MWRNLDSYIEDYIFTSISLSPNLRSNCPSQPSMTPKSPPSQPAQAKSTSTTHSQSSPPAN
jgi:hypothetical protein